MSNSTQSPPGASWRLLETALIAAVYYLLARGGQLLVVAPGNVTPIWPASGFALGVALLLGYRRSWLGIALGSFLGHTWALVDVSTAAVGFRTCGAGLAIAAGSVAQAFMAAYLIRRFCRDGYPFGRIRDVFIFVGSAVIGSLIGATVGVTTMAAADIVPWSDYAYLWATWFLGHFVGMLVVAPVIVTWRSDTAFMNRDAWLLEALALFVLTVTISAIVFTEYSPLATLNLAIGYTVAIPFIWAVLRFGHFGVSALLIVVAAIATWGTVRGYGPFQAGSGSLNESLLLLQIYAAHTLAAILILAAALSERKRAEDESRRTQERFRLIFESGATGITTTDSSGRFESANPIFQEMVGYTEDELRQLQFAEITHPDDLDESRRLFGELRDGLRDSFMQEKRYIRRDGKVTWSNTSVSCVRRDGRVRFATAVMVDITDRKKAEAESRENETKYQDLFENTRDLIQSVSPEGRFVYVNQAWKDALGYSDEEIPQLTIFDVIHADEQQHCRRMFERVMQGEVVDDLKTRFVAKDGRTIMLEGSSSCKFEEGKPIATRGIFHDVTKRRQAEAAQAESEQRLRAVMNNSTAVIYLKDLEGRYLLANREFKKLYKVKEKDLVGKTLFDMFPADVAEEFRNNDRQVQESGKVMEFEEVVPHSDGPHTYLSIKFPLRDAANNISAIAGISSDISAMKRVERELADSEARLRQIIDSSLAVVYLKDLSGRYLLVNQRYLDLFGISLDEVVGKTDFEVFPAELADAFRKNDVLVAQSGEIVECEEVAPHPDGPHTYLSIKCPVRDANGEIYAVAGISTDITDRKQAAEELKRYATELERSNKDLQQFAYVASHDLQEPLRAVTGFCQLLQRKHRDQLDEEARGFIDHIVDGAGRMQNLLTGLLQFSRVNTHGAPFGEVDCNEALQDAMANLQSRIEESHAEISSGELPTLSADASQVVQLQNLIGNAIKYRGDRCPHVRVEAQTQNGNWIFSVEDNGIGIDSKQADRIFTIFQRLHTRDQYPGTGIGLAICKRIVERHHGRIWIESKPNVGSTFYFTVENGSDGTPVEAEPDY